MRTTVVVDDELLAAARERARATGRPLGAVIDAGLRRELAGADGPGVRPAVPVFHGGTGPRPGVDLTSNAALHELLGDADPGTGGADPVTRPGT